MKIRIIEWSLLRDSRERVMEYSKKLPSKESVRRTRSRLGGALRGIGVLPNKQKSGSFLAGENCPICRKGTTRHCLPVFRVWEGTVLFRGIFLFFHNCVSKAFAAQNTAQNKGAGSWKNHPKSVDAIQQLSKQQGKKRGHTSG